MNNKGMTLMEVLISLVLISVVMIFLVNLLSDMKTEDSLSSKHNEDALTRASLINVIQGDIINKSLKDFTKNCDQKNNRNTKTCYQFTFADNTRKYLYVNETFIAYGPNGAMEKWPLNYGTYDINNIKITYVYQVNGNRFPNYLFLMSIPVTNTDTNYKRKYDVELTVIDQNNRFTCHNCW